MFFRTKKELPMTLIEAKQFAALYDAIFIEFLEWYEHEKLVDPENPENSLINNLSILNIKSLRTNEGQHRLDAMFGSKYNTATATRMADFHTHVVSKYGKEVVDRLIKHTLSGMSQAHEVPIETLQNTQTEIPVFWLLEMMKRCFRLCVIGQHRRSN